MRNSIKEIWKAADKRGRADLEDLEDEKHFKEEIVVEGEELKNKDLVGWHEYYVNYSSN